MLICEESHMHALAYSSPLTVLCNNSEIYFQMTLAIPIHALCILPDPHLLETGSQYTPLIHSYL